MSLQTQEHLEDLQNAEKHIQEAMKAFENCNEDCSNVGPQYLEPLRLDITLPDFSRLERPAKPPVPEVSALYFLNFVDVSYRGKNVSNAGAETGTNAWIKNRVLGRKITPF